ncbi:hypothetical protein G6O67_006980 [Ophiocordyceps sinensis]|uniref:Uncharacterized protein n=1 Tax=Ophiocordyceps sinensis TaxID=72228 RepID=A0A8H4LTC8_9HYPO|nr:hypothetical protein G6O67_006980 [Ophiocordyceps sinensis]
MMDADISREEVDSGDGPHHDTLVDMAHTLTQYVGLQHIAFEKGTADSAKKLVEESLATFAVGAMEGRYQALEKELNDFLSQSIN